MNTIIFDLDGTLLPMDTKHFVNTYFYEMSKLFDGFIEADKLIDYVKSCTGKMMANEEKISNEKVFMSHFKDLVGDKYDECRERFDKFYKDAYLKTKSLTKESSIMIESVKILKEKGYELVIATNPLFPKEAIDHRVRWAGLSLDDFSHITSYEENCFSKPNTKFYSEILEKVGKKSSECIMVGNDMKDDMVASTIGIKTFLITDHIIDDSDYSDKYQIDYRGKYEQFLDFVKELPSLV